MTAFLQVQHISQIYENSSRRLHALHNVNFNIERGEFVCIVGTSGSGKSTLLRILGGLLAPSSGRVVLAGEEIDQPPPSIGFVFQKSNLMPWRTVTDNILLPLEIQGRGPMPSVSARRICWTWWGWRISQTPTRRSFGGMAQRLALAGADPATSVTPAG
ncbi:MAG: ATP-binding cassette domain-containing protein [Caldilineaceae bacterium]